MADKFNFDRVLKNLEAAKRQVPLKVANATVNFFADSWKRQGFGNQSWKARKKETKKTEGKAILVGTGALSKAVQGSLRIATWDKIQMIVDVSNVSKSGYNYAIVHNNGTKTTPKRQFMGDNPELRKIQIKTYKETIDKIWKV
jgi:hypothetical protein